MTQRPWVRFPVGACAWVVGPGSGQGTHGRHPVMFFPTLPFFLSSCSFASSGSVSDLASFTAEHFLVQIAEELKHVTGPTKPIR